MTDNLDLAITQWVSKSIAPVVKSVDYDAIANLHDVKAIQHAEIASGLNNAAMSTPDSRSAHFFQSAAEANAHAALKHGDAAEIYRSVDPMDANDVASARDASEKAFQASQIADTANQTAQDIANSQALSAGIYADADAGNNNYVAEYNQQLFGKNAGYGMDDDDTDEDGASFSPDVAEMIISAENAADEGDDYRAQSAQAYASGDTDSAAQLSMLATDAYMTAHNYLRQAAGEVGMVGAFAKGSEPGHVFRGNQYSQGTGGLSIGKQPDPSRFPSVGRYGHPGEPTPDYPAPDKFGAKTKPFGGNGSEFIHATPKGPMTFHPDEPRPMPSSPSKLPEWHPAKAAEDYHRMHGNRYPDAYDA